MERRAGRELEDHSWQLAGARRTPELSSHPSTSIPTLGALADSVILNHHITSNPNWLSLASPRQVLHPTVCLCY